MSNEWVVVKPMISNQSCNNILAPIKTIKNAKPVSKYLNLSKTLTNKKNMERKPRIAKIFEKKTIYGSRVTENMAGIESVAKIKSVNSIAIKTKNKGVINSRPFCLKKNFPPCKLSLTLKYLEANLTTG